MLYILPDKCGEMQCQSNAECVKGFFFIPDRCKCKKGFLEDLEGKKCIPCPEMLCGCNPEEGMKTTYYEDLHGCKMCKCGG